MEFAPGLRYEGSERSDIPGCYVQAIRIDRDANLTADDIVREVSRYLMARQLMPKFQYIIIVPGTVPEVSGENFVRASAVKIVLAN